MKIGIPTPINCLQHLQDLVNLCHCVVAAHRCTVVGNQRGVLGVARKLMSYRIFVTKIFKPLPLSPFPQVWIYYKCSLAKFWKKIISYLPKMFFFLLLNLKPPSKILWANKWNFIELFSIQYTYVTLIQAKQ